MMSMAAGRKEVPMMERVVVRHRHFDQFLEQNGGKSEKSFQMGFDLRPRNP
jgi:hypothetical protein